MQRSQNMNQMEISGDDEHKNDSDHEYYDAQSSYPSSQHDKDSFGKC